MQCTTDVYGSYMQRTTDVHRSYIQCTTDVYRSYMQCTTDVYRSFPAGQCTIGLVVTNDIFYFAVPEISLSLKFSLKIWALLPTCLTNTHNKNQCGFWMSRHSKPRENYRFIFLCLAIGAVEFPLHIQRSSGSAALYSTCSNLNGLMLDLQRV